jgi:hypothetical protein
MNIIIKLHCSHLVEDLKEWNQNKYYFLGALKICKKNNVSFVMLIHSLDAVLYFSMTAKPGAMSRTN